MEKWIGVLSTTLQSRPVDLLSRKGVLFDTKQLSVSFYNNGTINGHIRICENFGSTKLEHIYRTHMQSFSAKVECPNKIRSRKFTQYLRMFSDGTDNNKSSKKANCPGGDCEGQLNLSVSCSHEWADGTSDRKVIPDRKMPNLRGKPWTNTRAKSYANKCPDESRCSGKSSETTCTVANL